MKRTNTLFRIAAAAMCLVLGASSIITVEAASSPVQYTAHVEDEAQYTSADGPFMLGVNTLANVVTVYKQDADGNFTVPIKAMTCSAGLGDTTPSGTFKTSDYYAWRLLVGGVRGQYAVRIYKGILFHSVPYMTYNKGNLQEGEYNLLGQDASHGCIRLSVEDTKWIYDNCAKGTTVIVYEDENPGPLGKPDTITVDPASPFVGWDPTDPDAANPWTGMLQFYAGMFDITLQQGYTPTTEQLIGATKAFDFDGASLPLTVDTSTLDVTTPGTYYITYSSTGKAGATVKQRVNVTVVQ